jgi:hypothetical protein
MSAVLWSERIASAGLPATCVLLAFLVFSLSNVASFLPELLHAAALAAWLGAFLWALRGFRRFARQSLKRNVASRLERGWCIARWRPFATPSPPERRTPSQPSCGGAIRSGARRRWSGSGQPGQRRADAGARYRTPLARIEPAGRRGHAAARDRNLIPRTPADATSRQPRACSR